MRLCILRALWVRNSFCSGTEPLRFIHEMYIVYIEAAVREIRVLFIGSSGFDDTLGVYGPDIAIVILEILVSRTQI